jgi:alkylation response protein AidB-like acyl-CoA dehydrogenase
MTDQALRAFVQAHVQPSAHAADRDGVFPAATLTAMTNAGLWGWNIDRRWGGQGCTSADCGSLSRRVGAACSSARALLTAHQMTASAIERWGSERHRSQWLPELAAGRALAAFALTEANAGSDVQAIETRAEAVPGGFALSGEKRWITGGGLAGVFLVFARGAAGVDAFLVPRPAPGLEVRAVAPMLGLRAAVLADLTLDRVFVGADARLGPSDGGLRFVAAHALELGRLMVAFGCLGLADACLREATRHAHARVQGGRPLAAHQLVQGLLAEIVVAVQSCEALLASAATRYDAHDPQSSLAVLVAKYHAAEAAVTASHHAVQILGARGCADDSAVQRFYRDAKIMEIIEGSTEVLKGLIAAQAGLMP